MNAEFRLCGPASYHWPPKVWHISINSDTSAPLCGPFRNGVAHTFARTIDEMKDEIVLKVIAHRSICLRCLNVLNSPELLATQILQMNLDRALETR